MKIIHDILSVSFFLLLGRLSGFFREWLIADRAGADIFSDFALVLITLPDLMVSLIVGGGFATALIPKFQSLNKEDAYRLFFQLFLIIGFAFTLLALILSFYGKSVLYILAPGIPREFVQENLILFWIVTIALPLTALSGILKAKLDSYSFFKYSAVGTLIFNIAIIILILIPFNLNFIESISFGVLLGASIRLIVQFIGLLNKVKKTRLKSNYNGINIELISSIFNTVSFSAVLILLPVIARSISSINNEGALSLFTYAYRINELPMALIVGSIVTVLLPTISSMHQKKSYEELRQIIIQALRYTTLISICISIPVVFFSDEIIELIFSMTKLNNNDLRIISSMLMISFIFLPFRALLFLLFPILSSVNHIKNLAVISFIIIFSLVSLSFALTNLYGLNGAMIAYGLSNLIGCICLYYQIVSKFSKSLLMQIFKRFKSIYFFPAISSVVISYIGSNFNSGILNMIIFIILSISVFLILVQKNEKELKNFEIFKIFSK